MILVVDGFDIAASPYLKWHYVTNQAGVSVDNSVYRTGAAAPAGSLKFASGISNLWVQYSIGAVTNPIVMGFAYRVPSVSLYYLIASTGTGFGSDFSRTGCVGVGFNNTTGGLDLYQNGWKNVAPGFSLAAGTWYYIECKWSSAGCYIYVNGNLYAGPVSVTAFNPTAVAFGTDVALPAAAYYDDMYLLDSTGTVNTDVRGNCRVSTVLPVAAGANAQWSPRGYVQVSDPGFEIPPVAIGGYQAAPAGSPWAFGGNAGVCTVGSSYSGSTQYPTDGRQMAYLTANSYVQQSCYFEAGTYTVSFQGASGVGNGKIKVTVDAYDLGTYQPPSSTFTSFTTPQFTVTAGTHVLKFASDATGASVMDSVVVAKVADLNYKHVQNPVAGGDAAYVASSTPAQVDTYDYANMAYSPTAVYCVQLNTMARKTTGPGRQLAAVGTYSGTTSVYTTRNITESYSNYCQVLESSPTGVPWPSMGASAVAVVNACEFGFRLM